MEEECGRIVDGLLPRLRSLLKSEHSTVRQKAATSGEALPSGYGAVGFTDKGLVAGLAKSFAADHHIDDQLRVVMMMLLLVTATLPRH